MSLPRTSGSLRSRSIPSWNRFSSAVLLSWGWWTFQGYPGRQPYASLPCGTGRGCVALRPVDRLGLFKVFQAHTDPSTHSRKEPQMIILGIVLVVVGLVASIPILETIGVILLVIGAILWILGSMGRAVGGRKHYY